MNTARTLQRVILPVDLDADVLPLYVDSGQDTSSVAGTPEARGVYPVVERPDQVLDRRRLVVSAGTRISFATYFNAFPASYWKRWTTLDAVELAVRVSGPARVAVYRSNGSGSTERVKTARNEGGAEAELVFRLPLAKFLDGGWYWFDVLAGTEDVIMEGAEWRAVEDASQGQRDGTITIGITTFNRPDYLLALLRQLHDATDVLEVIDEVVVVDQGTQRVRDQAGFAEIEARLEGKLRVIEQANVGGSGGFARGMYETLQGGRSRYVLVMDDDITAEPECILRALAFADRCRRPTIVGGHMFDLYAPTRLLHFGEVIRPWRYQFMPSEGVVPDHDLRTHSLRATPWMHRRVDVDYNAWWMCLIPVEVLKTVGLSLPVFIKWDDAEYGLRAKKAGFQTVTLPGVAIWHMPFAEKDDNLDWQAYFHHRNRIIAALLHSPYPRGGRLVRDSLVHQIRHLLALQYSVADLRLRAIEDALAGPEHLHAQLATKLPEVRAVRASYPDSNTAGDPETFPPIKVERPLSKDTQPTPPQGRLGNMIALGLIGLSHLRSVDPKALQQPEAELAAPEAQWWRLGGLDSALVSTIDGAGVSWYRRDRRTYVDLLRRSVAVHERLWQEWPALSVRYRESASDLTSCDTWRETFERLQQS